MKNKEFVEKQIKRKYLFLRYGFPYEILALNVFICIDELILKRFVF